MVAQGLTPEQREALSKTVDEMKLTSQEVDKFEKAFKDPEFLRLFEEYAKEMEDPANKAETEAYLRQVEQEGQFESVYGRGAQLLIPQAEFVVKAKVKNNNSKVFVNVCSSDKIDKPECSAATDKDGTQGENWAIPLCLSAQKLGLNKAGKECFVYDFTVHPETIERSNANPRFLSIVMDSAFERIEQTAGVSIQRNYRRLKMTFQATEGHDKPGVQAIRGQGGQVAGGRLKPNPDLPGLANLSAQRPKKAGPASPKAPATRSSFSFGASNAKAAPSKALAPRDPGYKHPDGAVTPQFEVVESGITDLGEAWGDKCIAAQTTCPRFLVIRVHLPGLANVAGVDLDVASKSMSLKVPGKFLLELDLPYSVHETKGQAKFDRSRSRLDVRLAVIPPPSAQPPTPHSSNTLDAPAPALITELPERSSDACRSATEQDKIETTPECGDCRRDDEDASATAAAVASINASVQGISSRASCASICEHLGAVAVGGATKQVPAAHSNAAGCEGSEGAETGATDAMADADTGAPVEGVPQKGQASQASGEAGAGADNLKALARNWARLNQERDNADKEAALRAADSMEASPAAENEAAMLSGAAEHAKEKSAGAGPDKCLDICGNEADEGLKRPDAAHAAALAAVGIEVQSPLPGAQGCYQAPCAAAKPIVLAPALQMSFAEELD